ncbi:beta-lactamase family protein [Aestuariibacter halophilus]|uniref:Beta-lactamase family protein n=1 Tax=Fluctibacter halophilus TaxID=226011 RepID=A0ABS8G8X0_9ALTE|nr:serine hydrolase domain-containing protein [Aestuariibacter halophilus]MCC2616536.1 beta-lactamase family protein [Aestuariibacter halophilus]
MCRLRQTLLGLTALFSVPVLATTSLSSEIDHFLDQHDLPGMVLWVQHDGEVVHFDAHGEVNTEANTAMTREHLFRIFSMTKPITAVAVMQLAEQGRIKLDEDIRTYLPKFDPFEVDGTAQTVTVHQLLSHTAGFDYGGGFDSWAGLRYLLANPLSRGNTLDELVDDVSGIELFFAPGTRWRYSIASDIQGALVEKVSGLPFDEYLRRHVLTPLAMHDTGFVVAPEDTHRLVDAYEHEVSTFEEAKTFSADNIAFIEAGEDSDYLDKPTLMSGGGGLVSTAQDYAHFVTMLASGGRFNGQQILSEASVDALLTSYTTGLDTQFLPRVYPDAGFGYGLGVQEKDTPWRAKGSFFWAGQGGTLFWSDPKRKVQVVAMMQVEDGWIALEQWLLPRIDRLIQPSQSNPALPVSGQP